MLQVHVPPTYPSFLITLAKTDGIDIFDIKDSQEYAKIIIEFTYMMINKSDP